MAPSEHDQTVRRSFQRQVDQFQRKDSPFAMRSTGALAWVEPLDPGMIVLDVACGAAHVAEQLAARVRQVVGIDLTPELLAVGAERLRSGGTTNVLLQVGNAAELPFVDGSFDLVVCRSSLHHFADPAVQVSEMARVCRTGGRVAVSDMVVPEGVDREALDHVHRQLDPSHAQVLRFDELNELLGGVGAVTVAEMSSPFELPVEIFFSDVSDREAVLTSLRAELDGGPATGLMPRADGDQLLVSVVNATVQVSG
jgi:ubiquinone/menaquinone biosynthesis C-methylase UbiE